jgi:hypothetical protein
MHLIVHHVNPCCALRQTTAGGSIIHICKCTSARRAHCGGTPLLATVAVTAVVHACGTGNVDVIRRTHALLRLLAYVMLAGAAHFSKECIS